MEQPGQATGPESWGRYPRGDQPAVGLAWADDPLPNGGPVLAYGMGRSYGDSCLNADGPLLLTRSLRRFIAFDADTGVLRAEAGTSLGEVTELVLARGWLPPVLPGTQFVTLGGAVANDIHGKNHHRAGSFGRHLRALGLRRSDGSVHTLRPGEALFDATVAGLGLTGLITWVELQLERVPGGWVKTEAIRFRSLEEADAVDELSRDTHAYTVAWIDGLARGRRLGRGVYFRGNLVEGPGRPPRRPVPRNVPGEAPGFLLSPLALRAFNALYDHLPRWRSRTSVWKFFHPLDALGGWNRLYGRRGFFQHQSVVPDIEGVRALLAVSSTTGQGSFLSVLKRFGSLSSPGMLSFPRPGWTLALDVPNRGEGTLACLEQMDAVVRTYGGAVYPAKDARMSAETFRLGFPRLDEFSAHVDPGFRSRFWARVMG
ncbi:MAG TPA: FAD-binding oxidoreductase [Myxococcaceae bacterium]|nr:FAD-binding oxidoreductase [Myxococcaceae bacterium]